MKRVLTLVVMFCALFANSNESANSSLNWEELEAKGRLATSIRAKNVTRVYSPHPNAFHLLYALDKNKLSGAIFTWNAYEKHFLPKELLNAPLVGGFYGQGVVPNFEVLASLKPQLVLMGEGAKGSKETKIFADLSSDVMLLNITTLQDHILALHKLSWALNADERGAKLMIDAQKTLDFAASLRQKLKNSPALSVYYAQGANGLQTECQGSSHIELVELLGAKSPLKCPNADGFGRVSVTFEEVVKFNPDVILVYDKTFFDSLKTDKKWRLLKAVREGRVYLLPRGPFSWFDRPSSFMRFLGVKWLAKVLYQDLTSNLDIFAEAKEFYKLWLDYDLDEATFNAVLNADFK